MISNFLQSSPWHCCRRKQRRPLHECKLITVPCNIVDAIQRYNAKHHPLLFQVGGTPIKKDTATPKEDAEGTIFEEEEEGEGEPAEEAAAEDNDEDAIDADKFIKTSKKRNSPANAGSSQKRGKKA